MLVSSEYVTATSKSASRIPARSKNVRMRAMPHHAAHIEIGGDLVDQLTRPIHDGDSVAFGGELSGDAVTHTAGPTHNSFHEMISAGG
jgi:hypothetical protein